MIVQYGTLAIPIPSWTKCRFHCLLTRSNDVRGMAAEIGGRLFTSCDQFRRSAMRRVGAALGRRLENERKSPLAFGSSNSHIAFENVKKRWVG